jgi:hypothetical protein
MPFCFLHRLIVGQTAQRWVAGAPHVDEMVIRRLAQANRLSMRSWTAHARPMEGAR